MVVASNYVIYLVAGLSADRAVLNFTMLAASTIPLDDLAAALSPVGGQALLAG